jgi:hypothetical protein
MSHGAGLAAHTTQTATSKGKSESSTDNHTNTPINTLKGRRTKAVVDLSTGLAVTREAFLAFALVRAGSGFDTERVGVARRSGAHTTRIDLNAAVALRLVTGFARARVSAGAGFDAQSVGVTRGGVLRAVVTLHTGLAVASEAVVARATVSAQTSLLALGVHIARVAVARVRLFAELAVATHRRITHK